MTDSSPFQHYILINMLIYPMLQEPDICTSKKSVWKPNVKLAQNYELCIFGDNSYFEHNKDPQLMETKDL